MGGEDGLGLLEFQKRRRDVEEEGGGGRREGRIEGEGGVEGRKGDAKGQKGRWEDEIVRSAGRRREMEGGREDRKGERREKEEEAGKSPSSGKAGHGSLGTADDPGTMRTGRRR